MSSQQLVSRAQVMGMGRNMGPATSNPMIRQPSHVKGQVGPQVPKPYYNHLAGYRLVYITTSGFPVIRPLTVNSQMYLHVSYSDSATRTLGG